MKSKIENLKWVELAPKTDKADAVMGGVSAKIDGNEMFVPMAEGNRHWDEIKERVDAGELTIEDAD